MITQLVKSMKTNTSLSTLGSYLTYMVVIDIKLEIKYVNKNKIITCKIGNKIIRNLYGGKE